jgi:hypothetical protein
MGIEENGLNKGVIMTGLKGQLFPDENKIVKRQSGTSWEDSNENIHVLQVAEYCYY